MTQINLENNGLFSGKSASERDELLNALAPYNTHGRLNLENNGEQNIVRTQALLFAMHRQGAADVTLSLEVMNSIADHLGGGAQFFTLKPNVSNNAEHELSIQQPQLTSSSLQFL